MKQIANWTLGSFFRTIGRFLFYLLVGYLLFNFIDLKELKLPGLFNVLDVYADTTDNWYFNLSHYGSGNFNYINHTSNGVSWLSNTTRDVSFNVGWTTGTESDIYLDYYLPSHTSDVTIAINGVSLSYFTDLSLRQGYLYNINSYFCANSSINNTTGQTRVGYSASNAYQASYIYSSTNITQLGNVLRGRTSSDNLYNCVLYSSLVVPSANGSWVNIKLTSSTSLSDRRLYFIGFDVRELGIYVDSIQSIISSSGFATASSVSQVQSSVNQVQQELGNVNSSIETQTQQQQQNHEETIDTLTDDSSPNISGLSNSAGWLPAGPVDSILNLPLSFLTNLNNSLSQNCSPVTLPLPYVNQNIQLPCLNSIYAQINGLPNWLNTIGTIASAFILFGYLINLYKYIDDTLTFRENNYIDNWSGV